MKVLVVGCWHLGSTIGACLADAGHEVHLWDQNESTARSWRTGKVPIFEPGLAEIVERTWGRSFFWCDELRRVSLETDWVILAYDTPVNENDEMSLDTVTEGFRAVLASGIGPQTRFLVTCQVPVGTTRAFLGMTRESFPEWRGNMLYQPENLRLGNAIAGFRSPDRAVLGIDTADDARCRALEAEFRTLVGNSELTLDRMSIESAEMVKHALNSFLASCIVFANEVSDICEKYGANCWDVFSSLKRDSRVGPRAFLSPGLGFAGGTLARDLRVLGNIRHGDASEDLFTFIYRRNQARNAWIIESLAHRLGSLAGRKIMLLGVTYKPQTSTVRRSPAIEIGRLLRAEGARCVAIDPMADLSELSTAEREDLPFELAPTERGAFRDADAVVLITEWPQFRALDWESILSTMRTPLVIDTKNFLTTLEPIERVNRVVPGLPPRRAEHRTTWTADASGTARPRSDAGLERTRYLEP